MSVHCHSVLQHVSSLCCCCTWQVSLFWLSLPRADLRSTQLITGAHRSLPSRRAHHCWLCRIDEERQKSGKLPTASSSALCEGANSAEDLQEKQHVIDVLQTEVEVLKMKLDQAVSAQEQNASDWDCKMDAERGRLRAAEFERDEMHKQCNMSLRQVEDLNEQKMRLEVRLAATGQGRSWAEAHGDATPAFTSCIRLLLLSMHQRLHTVYHPD